jgi:hypothetical protein
LSDDIRGTCTGMLRTDAIFLYMYSDSHENGMKG